jgi:hypothetical protein
MLMRSKLIEDTTNRTKMSSIDPRFVHGIMVHAKAMLRLTSLIQCHRRFVSTDKTKYTDGGVLGIEVITSSSKRQAATNINATYLVGPNCSKNVPLNSRPVKAGHVAKVKTNGMQPVTHHPGD